MHRRRYLQAVGGASAIGLAGCMGILGSDGSDGEPDGESFEFEGSGSWQSEPFSLEEGLVALDFHNFGDGNVIAHLREASETDGGLFVNVIGSFEGTSVKSVEAGEYYLNVDDADQWTVTVRQPRFSESEFESIPFETSETDWALLGPFEFERDTEASIQLQSYGGTLVNTITLDGNRAGRLIDASPNEAGEGVTTAVGQSGQGLLHVTAEGPWSLSVENP